MAAYNNRIIVLFRNDLRISDNPVLHAAVTGASSNQRSEVICLYCFDPRMFGITKFNSQKTGVYRAQFLIESVSNLRKRLQDLGSNLLVAYGKPEDIISRLLMDERKTSVFLQGEVTYEEIQVEKKVEKVVQQKNSSNDLVRIMGGCSLYHPEDLPFKANLSDMPNSFTPFKDKIESKSRIRPLLPPLRQGQLGKPSVTLSGVFSDNCSFEYLPSLSLLGFTEAQIKSCTTNYDTRSVMRFTGGEDAAIARIHEWMFRDDRLKDYFDLRNGLLGEAYSSKLSPWLAHGCISPRYYYS